MRRTQISADAASDPNHSGGVNGAATDTCQTARAQLTKLGALTRLGRASECPAAIDRAREALRRCPDPALLGEFHALAGFIANLEGSLDRSVTHLVCAGRTLRAIDAPDITAAGAWRHLAVAFSRVGFHQQATQAAARGLQIARHHGANLLEHMCLDVRLRSAVAHDHGGDAERCRAELVDLVNRAQQVLVSTSGPSAPWAGQVPQVEYAAARLAALGHPDMSSRIRGKGSAPQSPTPETAQLRRLSAVCRAIAEHRADDALRLLDRVTMSSGALGAAEAHRLRALAHAAAGEHTAADAADRAAFRAASSDLERVRALFVDGIALRLDREDAHRSAERRIGEALSDPLTGLANRRRLEQRVETMAEDRERGMLGVIDLDDFQAVNMVHGRLTGDLVLQRVAGTLLRTLRRRDFLARYGGDEFVVILPSATRPEAELIGQRLTSAVGDEDWEALAPGSPVAASIGWAELDEATDLVDAFGAADREMQRAKTRPR